ncbi:MAG: hypothetical protein ACP5VF_01070 [Acidobacteriota bacterium]
MVKSSFEWRDWGPSALEEAGRSRKPLFLLVTTFSSEQAIGISGAIAEDRVLSSLLARSFVPVLADGDCHPELGRLYFSTPAPAAALLHPDGTLLANCPLEAPGTLVKLLRSAVVAASHYSPPVAPVFGGYPVPFIEHHPRSLERGLELVEGIYQKLLDRLIVEGGEFGEGAGAPCIEPIRFLLRYGTFMGSREALERAVQILQSLAYSPLYDSVEGGFFHARDGSRLDTRKFLQDNAHWLILSLRVAAVPEGGFALPLARGILHYLQQKMLQKGGLFAAAQRDDDSYYALSGEERRRVRPPQLNAAALAPPNALAVRALCNGWQFLGERAYLNFAQRVHGRLESDLMGPDGALAHSRTGEALGAAYLGAQVELGYARLALYQSTLDPRYLEGVEKVARLLVSDYSNPAGLGFLDVRPKDRDRLAVFRPMLDPVMNARAAGFLILASAQLEDEKLALPARRVLGALVEAELEDLSALCQLGNALLVTLTPLAVYVAVTDGSSRQRNHVLEKLRKLGASFSLVMHRGPSRFEKMQALPRLIACCGNQQREIPI